MKRLLKWVTGFPALSLVLLLCLPNQKVQAQVGVSVSYQTFYDDLSPYGQWVDDPGYGNVWVPYAEQGFRPYSNRGHWAATEYGNTWVSDYPWGWAAFHYGRWTSDPYYGWVWIPGTEWAPAWVSWRYGNGGCGWAPMGPGISVSVSVGGGWHCPNDWWVFVGPEHLYSPNPYNYSRGPRYNNTYINQTTIINNTYIDNSTHVTYNYGPKPSMIQSVTNRPVQVYRLSAVNTPGSTSVRSGVVNIYRPVVNRATITTARPANVMRAPQAVSRTIQPASVAANRTPPFQQVVRQQNPAMVRTASVALRNPTSAQAQPQVLRQQLSASRPSNTPTPVNNSRPLPNQAQRPNPGQVSRPNSNPVVNNQAARNLPQSNNNRPQQTQPQNRLQSQPQQSRPQPQQNYNRPQSQPQQNRPQPQPNYNRPQPQPQQSRPQPQPNYNRPQPQSMPQQSRPQPQPNYNRPQPQPQNRPQPQSMPQQQSRPQPQPQQHSQAPAPRMAPAQGGRPEEGRR